MAVGRRAPHPGRWWPPGGRSTPVDVRGLADLRVIDFSTGIAGAYCTQAVRRRGRRRGQGRAARRRSAPPVVGHRSRPRRAGRRAVPVPPLREAVGHRRPRRRRGPRSRGRRPICSSRRSRPATSSATALPGGTPRLVILSITPFGRDGPWARPPGDRVHRPGRVRLDRAPGTPDASRSTPAVASASGSPASTRRRRRSPRSGAPRRTGHGDHVDVSMLEAMSIALMTSRDLAHRLHGQPAASPRRPASSSCRRSSRRSTAGWASTPTPASSSRLPACSSSGPTSLDDAELADAGGPQAARRRVERASCGRARPRHDHGRDRRAGVARCGSRWRPSHDGAHRARPRAPRRRAASSSPTPTATSRSRGRPYLVDGDVSAPVGRRRASVSTPGRIEARAGAQRPQPAVAASPTSPLPLAGIAGRRLHGVVGRPVVDRMLAVPRRRRDPRRVDPTARRHAHDRRHAPDRATSGGSGAPIVPGGQHQQAGHHARPHPPRRVAAGCAPDRRPPTPSSRTSRPGCSSSSAWLGRGPRHQPRARSWCGCRRSGWTARGATDLGFAQTMEQITGPGVDHRHRRRPAPHPAGSLRPAGRDARGVRRCSSA